MAREFGLKIITVEDLVRYRTGKGGRHGKTAGGELPCHGGRQLPGPRLRQPEERGHAPPGPGFGKSLSTGRRPWSRVHSECSPGKPSCSRRCELAGPSSGPPCEGSPRKGAFSFTLGRKAAESASPRRSGPTPSQDAGYEHLRGERSPRVQARRTGLHPGRGHPSRTSASRASGS